MKAKKRQKNRIRMVRRIYKPFTDIVIPVIFGTFPEAALGLARFLTGQVNLLGMIIVDDEKSISAAAAQARHMRQELDQICQRYQFTGTKLVRVSYKPWNDMQAFVQEKRPDLLILEYTTFIEHLYHEGERTADLSCNVALVRGPLPEQIDKILIPLRGGPHAQLALRLALSLPAQEKKVLHLKPSKTSQDITDAPFRGLEQIIPNLPEITYQDKVTDDPIAAIQKFARKVDLLISGTSITHISPPAISGNVTGRLMQECTCGMVEVKSRDKTPAQFSGPEGERSGVQAISVLVDKWFAQNTYHSTEFDNLDYLVSLKKKQNVTISLAMPALNEEETVGQVIQTIQDTLIEKYPLLDEIVLIDSRSTDRTCEIAASLGVQVYTHQDLLPTYEERQGKGEALWKSLLVTRGDIVVWIDTDIKNIHPRFVYGVIGPFLVNPGVQFVKGFYQRPLKSGELTQSGGGGRVTELAARPLINLFYPQLSGIIQPLAGEYGGRRQILEQLPFSSGYGVETGLLIDVLEKCGLSAIAQVDLFERIHHNQPLEALSKMSFIILQTFLRRLEHHLDFHILEEVNRSMKLIQYHDGNYFLKVEELVEYERPPMLQIPEYLARKNRS